MIRDLLAVGILISGLTGAFAQDAAPSPAPTELPAPAASPAPAKLYYLEVEPADLDAISRALMELPKKVADPLILKLNAQLQAQDKIVAKAKPAEEPKKGKK